MIGMTVRSGMASFSPSATLPEKPSPPPARPTNVPGSVRGICASTVRMLRIASLITDAGGPPARFTSWRKDGAG